MHGEPLCVLDLFLLPDDLATGIAGMKAEHQRVRKRPVLTALVLDVADLDAHLLAYLTSDALLHRLAGFDEAGQVLYTPVTKRGERASKTSSPRVTSTIMLGDRRGY